MRKRAPDQRGDRPQKPMCDIMHDNEYVFIFRANPPHLANLQMEKND